MSASAVLSSSQIPPKPAICAVHDNTKNIIFVFVSDIEGNLSLFSNEGGKWQKDEQFSECVLSKLSSKKIKPSVGEISGLFEPNHHAPGIFFKNAESGFLNYCYKTQKGKWVLDTNSFKDMKVAKQPPVDHKNFGTNLISAVFEPNRNCSAVFFKGEDNCIHYYYFNQVENRMYHDGISFKKLFDGAVGGAVSAVFEPPRNHSAVFFSGDEGIVHYIYLNTEKGCWHHDGVSFGEIAAGGDIASLFEPNRSHSCIFMTGPEGYLRYHFLGAPKPPENTQNWTQENISFKLGGRIKKNSMLKSVTNKADFWKIGSIAVEYNLALVKKNHSCVAYVGEDENLHYFWLAKNGFWMNTEISDMKSKSLPGNDGGFSFASMKFDLSLKNDKICSPCGKISMVKDPTNKRVEIFYYGSDSLVYRVFLDQDADTFHVDNTFLAPFSSQ